MVRFFLDSGLPSRRSRAAARRRRQSDRDRDLRLESLEPRLALAVLPGTVLADTVAPVVRSVALPAAGTYGTDHALSFKVNFSEPVKLAGDLWSGLRSALRGIACAVDQCSHELWYIHREGVALPAPSC